MGWRFPKRKPRPDNVMDYRDFQEATQPFVEELGSLDESNFSDSLSTQLGATDVAIDIHRRFAGISVENNDDVRINARTGVAPVPPLPVTVAKVDVYGTWVPIPDMRLTFTSRGGILDVSASMQAFRPDEEIGQGADDAYNVAFSNAASALFYQFGIEFDGTVVAESIVGDLDAYTQGQAMEVGMSGLYLSPHLESTLKATSGYHEIRVVVRLAIGPKRYAVSPDNLNAADLEYPVGSLYLGSRELAVTEDS